MWREQDRPPNKYGDHVYVVAIEGGETIKARNVVMAKGLYQTLKISRLSLDFPAQIKQLHSAKRRATAEDGLTTAIAPQARAS